MKWSLINDFVLLLTLVLCASAQPLPDSRGEKQNSQVLGYWVDPSTGLMWASKDNGRDLSWQKASSYCRDMRLAGHSDWRLATIDELQNIYDPTANAPGPANRHVKGNLYLTGHQWSSTRRNDDRGRPTGYAWRFDFTNGIRFGGDQLGYSRLKRALCVRRSEKAAPTQ